jgi:hypothetical protein
MKNLTGLRFGDLTVGEYAGSVGSAQHAAWHCVCDCGNKVVVVGASIRAGRSKSCGCKSKQQWFTADRMTTHGKSRSDVYKIWAGMLKRCSDKSKGKTRKNYFDKGIRVCDRWMEFENFYEDMGDRPIGMTIERIDGTSGYEPGNCKWATAKQQANNTSQNHVIEFKGEKLTVSQLADKFGIKQNSLLYRIRRGWSVEKAATTPMQKRKLMGEGGGSANF